MACHLLKAVEGWSDLGYGDFSIHYLRDKAKREVDFVVTRDNAPWFLVEVKKSKENLSGSLAYFQQKTHAKHAFQAIVEAEYVDGDCFAYHDPISVPAKTFFESIAVMEPTQRKKVFRIAIECAGRIRRGARAVSHRGRREIPAGFYRSRAGYFKARPKKLKKLCDSIQPAQKRFVLLCVKNFAPRAAPPPYRHYAREIRTRGAHAARCLTVGIPVSRPVTIIRAHYAPAHYPPHVGKGTDEHSNATVISYEGLLPEKPRLIVSYNPPQHLAISSQTTRQCILPI